MHPYKDRHCMKVIFLYTNLMKQHYFSIVIEHDKNAYFVSCPELQGCYSQGATYEEAVANIRDAISLHIEDRQADHEELPITDSVSVATIMVAV